MDTDINWTGYSEHRGSVVVRALMALCVAVTVGSPLAAARLDLTPVPHYKDPFPLPPLTPITPLYTKQYSSQDAPAHNGNDQQYESKAIWEWFVTTYYHTLRDPVALFTFVLAISTIGLWMVTWRSGVRQSRQTRASIRIAEQALISVERAFIFLEEIDTDTAFDTNDRATFVIKPRWKNSGSTPPKNMIVNVDWILYSGDLPNTFPYKYDNLPPMKMFVGPGATEWSAPVAIPPEENARIFEGSWYLYIWGRADYEDIFDETRPHFTEWCYRFNIIRGARENAEQFVAYGDHNRSD